MSFAVRTSSSGFRTMNRFLKSRIPSDSVVKFVKRYLTIPTSGRNVNIQVSIRGEHVDITINSNKKRVVSETDANNTVNSSLMDLSNLENASNSLQTGTESVLLSESSDQLKEDSFIKNVSKSTELKDYHHNTENIPEKEPSRPTNNEITSTRIDSWLPPLPEIKDPALYERVFTDKSYRSRNAPIGFKLRNKFHNGKLSFIGDSILSSLVTMIIYDKFPDATTGHLYYIRSNLINNRTLARISFQYGLDKKLRSRVKKLNLEFVEQKEIADVFEAYIGALVIERGLNLSEVKNWLFELYQERLKRLESHIVGDINTNAVNELNFKIANGNVFPEYAQIQQGDGVKVNWIVHCTMKGEVIGMGKGLDMKEASLRAAMDALKNKEQLEKYKLRPKMEVPPVKQSLDESANEEEELTPTELDSDISSSIDMSFFPIKAGTKGAVRQKSITTRLSKEVLDRTGTMPEYITNKVIDNKYIVTLKIRGIEVAVASDASEPSAMRRAAKALLDNKEALEEICKQI